MCIRDSLYVKRTALDSVTSGIGIGFFYDVRGSSSTNLSEIRNLVLDGELMSITGVRTVGALAASMVNARAANIEISGSVSALSDRLGCSVGGMSGAVRGIIVSRASFQGEVSTDCAPFSSFTGGLIGYAESSLQLSEVNVSAEVVADQSIGLTSTGGVVGSFNKSGNGSFFREVHFAGSVKGGREVGGLAGNAGSILISLSSASGTIDGAGGSVGGLAGALGGSVFKSFFSGQVRAGSTPAGGLFGCLVGDIFGSFVAGSVEAVGLDSGVLEGLEDWLETLFSVVLTTALPQLRHLVKLTRVDL